MPGRGASLIVGSAGMLGRCLTLKAKRTLRTLDPAANDGGYACRLQDEALARRAFVGASTVIDVAGMHGPDLDAGIAPSDLYQNNISAAESLVRLSEQARIDFLVYVSTTAVYGHQHRPFAISESSEPNPQDEYARSKLLAERIVKNSNVERVAIIRAARFTFASRCQRLAEFLESAVDIEDLADLIWSLNPQALPSRLVLNAIAPPPFDVDDTRTAPISRGKVLDLLGNRAAELLSECGDVSPINKRIGSEVLATATFTPIAPRIDFDHVLTQELPGDRIAPWRRTTNRT